MSDTQAGALYDRLRTTPAVSSLLALYAGAPAVFVSPVPEDAILPALVISPPVDESREDTKVTRGTSTTRDILVLINNKGSSLSLDALAEAVKAAVHRQPLSWTGRQGWRCVVVRDSEQPTDDTMLGRAITVVITAQEV